MAVGVVVSTATRSAPSSGQNSSGSTYFVAGITERGDTTKAVKVSSLADYETQFGGRVSYGYLWDDLQTHFEEGGVAAYVARVVGASASKSTLTLIDRAGSPVSTLRIDAVNPGSWGTGITVQVEDGSLSNTFKLTIRYTGTGNVGTEIYNNLATPAAAVTALASSAYVRGVNLASATAAPNNNPAVISATALSSGSDDRNSVDADDHVTALELFGDGLGTGAVAIPGQPASSVAVGLQAHAEAHRRVALIAPAAGRSKSQAITDVASAAAAIGSDGLEYVGFFWPHVKVPDGSGATRTISPEGYVSAMRARAHEQEGPARAPAGQIALAEFVVDTETPLTAADIDDLNAVSVSPIAEIHGSIQLYGWRSLSTDTSNYALLTQRDAVNYVTYDLEREAESFVWRTIDGRGFLFAELNGALTSRLELLRAAKQLFELTDDAGNQIDPGYKVDTSSAVNTPASIAQNILRADVSIRPSPSAELVKIQIAKVAVNGSV